MSNKDQSEAGGVKPGHEIEQDGRGKLIVVSAPSGGGKSTLVQEVLERDSRLRFSVSYTTREPRGAEREGVEYHFVSRDEFLRMQQADEFLESAEVHGYMYGTRRDATNRILASGYDLLLDIDVQGAAQVRRNIVDAVTVFIMPPSREVLQTRLRLRSLNSPEDIERRLRAAAMEVRLYREFDYVIVNDNLDTAVSNLQSIIVAERQRPDRQHREAQKIVETFGGEPFHA